MVTSMMVLDTSFLVSFYRLSDENNQKARATLHEKEREGFLLPSTILFETVSVLNYKEGFEKAREAYDDLVSNEDIEIYYLNETEQDRVLQEFFFHTGKVSVADACVIYLSKKNKMEALAFDKGILRILKTR